MAKSTFFLNCKNPAFIELKGVIDQQKNKIESAKQQSANIIFYLNLKEAGLAPTQNCQARCGHIHSRNMFFQGWLEQGHVHESVTGCNSICLICVGFQYKKDSQEQCKSWLDSADI